MGIEQFNNINAPQFDITNQVSSRVNAANNFLAQAGPELLGVGVGIGVVVWGLRKVYKETLGNII